MSKAKDERELLSKPGDTILETIEALKMTQVELGKRMGKTPSKINDLITGKEPITVNTAVQLENVLGVDTQFWLNRESQYREQLLRIEQEEALEECNEWLATQPIKQLKAHGYIADKTTGATLVTEILQFYRVDSPAQWEHIYVEEFTNTVFRKSSRHAASLGSMAAFLRIGEIEMLHMQLVEYNKDMFKQILVSVLGLVEKHPEDFAGQLRTLCLLAGVAIVYTPNFPGNQISGAARWVAGNPLVQLTDRFKTNDQFWFSFFHEAGHILLHGKKDVFIEDFDLYTRDEKKETEADEFAANTLLPMRFLDDLPQQNITEKDIRSIARQYKTNPAIVVGRLARLKKVHHSFAVGLKRKVVLDHYIIKKT